MHLASNSNHLPPGAEALEARSLLSALALPAFPYVDGAVEVVEVEVDAGDEGDVEVAPSELPANVATALNARFPGAEVVEADFSIEDGEGEFGVSVRFSGRLIDVTLTPAGEITQVEQAISAKDLPRELLNWIAREYPGSEIDEAVAVSEDGIVNYEVLIETQNGEAMEATLRPAANDDSSTLSPAATAPEEELQFVMAGLSSAIADSAGSEALLESETVGAAGSERQAHSADETALPALTPVQQTPSSGHQASPARGLPEFSAVPIDADTVAIDSAQAALIVDTFGAFAGSAVSAAWLPQVAGMLNDVLSGDLSAVERGLDQIKLLAGASADDMAGNSGASRLAMIAALVTSELVVRAWRKDKEEPVLVSIPANSSWSWVLGAPTSKRIS